MCLTLLPNPSPVYKILHALILMIKLKFKLEISIILQKLIKISYHALFTDGAIYAVGGYDGINYVSSVERLDPRVRILQFNFPSNKFNIFKKVYL